MQNGAHLIQLSNFIFAHAKWWLFIAIPVCPAHLAAKKPAPHTFFSVKRLFIMNSGNWFVVGILVAMSFQFLSQGAVAPVFSGLIPTAASCSSVIVQTFVALFSVVFSMIFCSW